jgi:hypothetical protein
VGLAHGVVLGPPCSGHPLLVRPGPIRDAFIGGPVEEVLEMVRWALSHEDVRGLRSGRGPHRLGEGAGTRARSGRSPRSTEDERNIGAARPAVALARILHLLISAEITKRRW